MYLQSWEDFAKAAEQLCQANPNRCRIVLKYRHGDGVLSLKATDDVACVQYKAEHAQDVKKAEKLISQLMRYMTTSK